MTDSETSDSFYAGTAHSIDGTQFDVTVDAKAGTVALVVDGEAHALNLGHLEQLDNAVRRALIWLALHPDPNRRQ